MMISYNSLLKESRIFIKDYFMKNFKSALDRFESAKISFFLAIISGNLSNCERPRAACISVKQKLNPI